MKKDKAKDNRKTTFSKAVFVVIALIFVVLLCVYPGNNLFTWINARKTIRNQEKEIREYQKTILEMDARIKSLTSTKDSLERFAREHFHFAEPGEDIYVISGQAEDSPL